MTARVLVVGLIVFEMHQEVVPERPAHHVAVARGAADLLEWSLLNGVRLRYLIGGRGSPVVVLRAPRDWSSLLDDPDFMVQYRTLLAAFDAYRRDLYWAQEYARFNREIVLVVVACETPRRRATSIGRASPPAAGPATSPPKPPRLTGKTLETCATLGLP